MRRLRNGVEIGPVRLFLVRGWRTKPHPYFFARKWGNVVTIQTGPIELFIRNGV